MVGSIARQRCVLPYVRRNDLSRPMAFRLLHTDPKSHARAGELDTGHGTVPTPCSCPWAPWRVVKTVHPRELRATTWTRR